MDILRIFSIVLLVGYGLLVALAGPQQLRQRRIQSWAAMGMLVAGLFLLTAAYLLWVGSAYTLTVLLIGLIAMHALAVANGLYMHGKINPSHHVARLGLSLLLLILTYSVLH